MKLNVKKKYINQLDLIGKKLKKKIILLINVKDNHLVKEYYMKQLIILLVKNVVLVKIGNN